MKYNALIISVLLIGVSCTRNVDLEEVFEERIVIEAVLSKDSTAQVWISKTVNATESDSFPQVTNATVLLNNSQGVEEILTEKSAGFYQSNLLKGTEGETYNLSVTTADETVTASAKIPFLSVDLLEIIFRDFTNTDSSFLDINFQKNGADSLYCLFRVFKNDSELSPTIFYQNEIPTTQNLAINLLNVASPVPEDVFKVQVEQMEKWQYDYLLSAQQNNDTETISGLLIGPPDNLVGNISGDALGYFGATTKGVIEIVY